MLTQVTRIPTDRRDARPVVIERNYYRAEPQRASLGIGVVSGWSDEEIASLMQSDAALRDAKQVEVRGKVGVMSGTPGEGVVVLRWREAPGTLVTIRSRGDLDEATVLAVAGGLRRSGVMENPG